MFTETQIAHLNSLRFINNVDQSLKIISAVQLDHGADDVLERVLLLLELYFEGERVSQLSFNLHNHSYEEIVDVARNVRNNDYLMHEVDTYLSGDIE